MNNLPILLVTKPEFEKAADIFTATRSLSCYQAPVEETELAALVRKTGCRAVVLGVTPYRHALYEALADNAQTSQSAAGAGALLVRFGLGTDSIDKTYVKAKGLTLVNTPIDIQTSVAELTLFLIGAVIRQVPRLDAEVRSGGFTPLSGRELHGKTALIIGSGKIGLKVAHMLHFGFGVRVLAHDRAPEAEWLATAAQTREKLGVIRYSQNLDSLLPLADLTTIHLPLTAETRNIINAHFLARMKPGSVLINTGRGGLVDEAALFDVLATGHLSGAASDVFVNEPYVPVAINKDLRTLPNMLLTPHCGSNTREANARMAINAIEQATNFLI